eukprot:jgi/Tetstr1/432953/TSEL_022291.t1
MADTKQAARHRATYDKLPASDGSPTRRDVTEGESGKGHVQIDVHATRDGAAYHKGELERGKQQDGQGERGAGGEPDLQPGAHQGRPGAAAQHVHGPLCHFWYKLLDESVLPSRPKSPLAIALKIALDQLLFGPLFLIIFWTVLKTFEGRPYEALPLIEAKLFPTMIVGYMLWPAAHIINFRFIPSAQRVLYINLITIFWTTYLSWSSQTQVAPVE